MAIFYRLNIKTIKTQLYFDAIFNLYRVDYIWRLVKFADKNFFI